MNCTTCKYAVLNDVGCICSIHVLSTGVICLIDNSNIYIDCPCHSELKHEEIRSSFASNDKRNSFDVCEICQRLVYSLDNLKIISKKIKNRITKKRTCKICSGDNEGTKDGFADKKL